MQSIGILQGDVVLVCNLVRTIIKDCLENEIVPFEYRKMTALFMAATFLSSILFRY